MGVFLSDLSGSSIRFSISPLSLAVCEPRGPFFWVFLFSPSLPSSGVSLLLICPVVVGGVSRSPFFLPFDFAVDRHRSVLHPPVGATCFLVGGSRSVEMYQVTIYRIAKECNTL